MFTAARTAPQAAGLSCRAIRGFLPAVLFVLCLSPSLAAAESPHSQVKIGAKAGWVLIHPAMYRLLPAVAGPELPDRKAAAGLDPDATIGFPKTMIRCRLGQDVTLRAGASVDLGECSSRPAKDSHMYRKGAISTTGVTVGAYLDISPVQGLTATLGLEYDMKRRYEIRSDSGNKKEIIRVGNTPALQLGLGYRF
jgi:hypothetical protein